MDDLLFLRDVSLRFDDHGRGITDVSLALRRGQIGAVVGPRDAGKTTLLRVASGMVRASGGEVLLAGRDLGKMSDRERAQLLGGEVAWACRAGPGGLRLRALEYVGLPLVSGHRLGSGEPKRRAQVALMRVGMADCADVEWLQLSSWQRVCVELAQAIVRGPSLLLIDDLLDGLARSLARDAMRLIRKLAEEHEFGVLLTAGEMDCGVLADRLWNMEEGELFAADDADIDGDAATVVDLSQRRSRGSTA